MKGWALTALIIVIAVLYARHRASQLGSQAVAAAEQGTRAPLNMFSPAFWGLKDDGSTFGTRGWWANLWSTAPPGTGGAPDDIEWIGDIPTTKSDR